MNNSQIHWTVQYRTIKKIMWHIDGTAQNMKQARDNGLEKAADYLSSNAICNLSAGEIRSRLLIFPKSTQKGPIPRVSAPKVTEEFYVIDPGRPYSTAIVITYFEE